MSFKGLAHLGVYTDDINLSKQFYIDYFGFKLIKEVILDKPNNNFLKLAFLDLNGFVIELLESSDKTVVRRGNSGSVEHFAIQVDNIDELVNELTQKGIKFETNQPMYNEILQAKMIFFRGPSEERIELFQYL